VEKNVWPTRKIYLIGNRFGLFSFFYQSEVRVRSKLSLPVAEHSLDKLSFDERGTLEKLVFLKKEVGKLSLPEFNPKREVEKAWFPKPP